MCHCKQRRGWWRQAGRHRLHCWDPHNSAASGDPQWGGFHSSPTREAPGKRRLLLLGRMQFLVAGRAAAAQQAGRPRRQPRAVLGLWEGAAPPSRSCLGTPALMAALHSSGPPTGLLASSEEQSALSLPDSPGSALNPRETPSEEESSGRAAHEAEAQLTWSTANREERHCSSCVVTCSIRACSVPWLGGECTLDFPARAGAYFSSGPISDAPLGFSFCSPAQLLSSLSPSEAVP